MSRPRAGGRKTEENSMRGLREIRKKRGLSQQKVAMDLNISREALSYYETGKRSPDISMLITLSDYFHVSIDYLIRGSEPHAKNSGEPKA